MNNEWKKVTLNESDVEYYSEKCRVIRTGRGNNTSKIFIPAKLCRYNKGVCTISYLPHFDFAEKLESYVKERENGKYEFEIDNIVQQAIWDAVDEDDEDYDEKTDALYEEWRDGRFWLNAKDRRAFDEEFLSKLSA